MASCEIVRKSMATNSNPFKNIPGCPGYLVNVYGEVFSERTSKILSPAKTAKGYHTLRLMVVGKPKTFYVHNLVLITFKGPRPKGQEGRHLDGDKDNNTALNLEWGTQEQNRLDNEINGVRIGRPVTFQPEKAKELREQGLSFSAIASKLGCSIGTAHRSCHD